MRTWECKGCAFKCILTKPDGMSKPSNCVLIGKNCKWENIVKESNPIGSQISDQNLLIAENAELKREVEFLRGVLRSWERIVHIASGGTLDGDK